MAARTASGAAYPGLQGSEEAAKSFESRGL